MNRLLSSILILWMFETHVSAQFLSSEERKVPGVSGQAFWSAGFAYPESLAGGATVVLGKRRLARIAGRGSTLRGLAASADIGPGAVSGRIGWANMFEYDAGVDGWSFEALYVRPWLLEWGARRGANYVGAGVTRYFGFLRVSGAVVASDSKLLDVSPSIGFGFVMPFP